jgi:geranylgeranyl reductase family protein
MTCRHDVDLLVVGAGPAGIAAGIESRRLGLSTVVVDKARFPRDKTCGDGLTTSALRWFDELGLDVRELPSYASVREIVIVGPDGRELSLPLPVDGEYAGVVPRRELDTALVLHARRRGVEVHEGHGLRALRARDDAVDAELDDDTRLSARWVIGADGHYSAVRRLVHAEHAEAPDLGTWHAFRQYFHGVDDPRLWVLFEEDLLPGYAWVFPVGDGGANVGLGVLRDSATSGKQLAQLWRAVIARPSMQRVLGPRAEAKGAHRAWPIPASWSEDALGGPARVLFAGDAAGVVDPMTGEGIAQALETGTLAARAVAYGGHPANVAAQYRAAVRASLGADLRLAGALQRVLRSPIGARAALAGAGLTPWTRRNFARWMFEDYPRAIVMTPHRWRHGMLAGAGAYPAGRPAR